MHSKIYTGWVAHQRYSPQKHGFRYRTFMMFLNLDETNLVFKNNILWSYLKPNIAYFRRADYFGNPRKNLKDEISDLVLNTTGKPTQGAVCLLTNMRYFGHCFNPVSFYYCFGTDGKTLQAIVTHITNTPWGEDYVYVHDFAAEKLVKSTKNGVITAFKLDKKFHVSPFMPMEIEYDWAFKLHEKQLLVHMKNFHHGNEMFNATLSLQAHEITPNALNLLLIQYPFITIKVIIGIYWNALLLWLKRVPFYSHPLSHNKD